MHEQILHGIENFPAALDTLLRGGNEGKLLLQAS